MEKLRRIDWWYWLVCIPLMIFGVNFVVWGEEHGSWAILGWIVFWLLLMNLFRPRSRPQIISAIKGFWNDFWLARL